MSRTCTLGQRGRQRTPDRPSTLRGTARTTLPKSPYSQGTRSEPQTCCQDPHRKNQADFDRRNGEQDVAVRSRTFGRLLLRCDDLSEKSAPLVQDLHSRTASPRPPQRRATYTPDRAGGSADDVADVRKSPYAKAPRAIHQTCCQDPHQKSNVHSGSTSTPRGRAQTTLPMCARVRTLRHPERYTNMLPGSTPEKSPTSSPKELSGKEKTGWKTAMYGAPRRGLPAQAHARIQRRTT